MSLFLYHIGSRSAPERSGRTVFVECLSNSAGTVSPFVVGEIVGMGTPRQTTELQLARLKVELDHHSAKLAAAGKTEAEFQNDAKWRKLAGDSRQIRARLRKISEVEAQNVEVARLKAEREAAAG